jgi:SAM-dependent methyltransferase
MAERESIRSFMERHREYLRGRVLDYGAGKQPYRDLVDGEYVPFEKGDRTPLGFFNAVMCNQVIQYVPNPCSALRDIGMMLAAGGKLLITYPTNWDEVEGNDLWRFTSAGMESLLTRAGFNILIHERRAVVTNQEDGFKFPLGYGCVAERI